MPTDRAESLDENAPVAGQSGVCAPAGSGDDLTWAVVKMQADELIAIKILEDILVSFDSEGEQRYFLQRGW